jgi:hypothetical protein
MMDTIRRALLKKAVQSLADLADEEISRTLSDSAGIAADSAAPRTSLEQSCPSALIQLHVDLGFLLLCFFQRNLHGFGTADMMDAKLSLEKLSGAADHLLRKNHHVEISTLHGAIEDTHRHVLDVCDLLLSSLFGEDSAARSLSSDLNLGIPSSGSNVTPLFQPPLPSSRRFALLPIQNDRSISELQRRGKLGKNKVVSSDTLQEAGSGVIGSGLGFFSSLYKKK